MYAKYDDQIYLIDQIYQIFGYKMTALEHIPSYRGRQKCGSAVV